MVAAPPPPIFYFWPDAFATACELQGVLRPDGRVAPGYQDRAHMPLGSATTLRQAGARLWGAGEVEQGMRAAG
jgi:hypothetical protein